MKIFSHVKKVEKVTDKEEIINGGRHRDDLDIGFNGQGFQK